MEQALFRIGGVYRCGHESDEPFQILPESEREGFHNLKGVQSGYVITGTGWRLSDGRWYAELDRPGSLMHLIPGELHNFNGEWLPVEEKPVADPDAWDEFCKGQIVSYNRLAGITDPNAAMIARDGPQVTRPAPPPAPQESTSHAPVKGLLVLMERDHRLGLGR